MTRATSVLELLADHRSYPERTSRVEQIATHISWVFLTDRFAYKLKKPVRYDFLDFSTVEKRRGACLRELQLNRRLAPDIYLDVIPVTKSKQGVLALGRREGAEPIDWVVRMRRLPASQCLEHLILTNSLRKPQLEELSRKLAQFYRQLPPLHINVDTYRRRIEDHIEANYRELHPWASERGEQVVVKRLHAAQLRLLRVALDLLDNRVCDGRVIDGHGDLRPEHIYFHPNPIAIDCVEFNDEFRELDVLDELAFLAIECDRLGAPWIGDHIIDHYEESSGDHFSRALLDFYKIYRCCVRAKVMVLRSKQVDDMERYQLEENACAYLRIADRYAMHLGPSVLLVAYGLSGTGKSTLAKQLAALLGIDVLNTDLIRKETSDTPAGVATVDPDLYRPEKRAQVYDHMFSQADAILSDGLSVILDGTFADVQLRCRAMELAERRQAIPIFLHCQCPKEIAIQRILARMSEGHSLSDATPEVYERQRQQFDPDSPALKVFYVDTSLDSATVLAAGLAAFKSAVPLSICPSIPCNTQRPALAEHRAQSC